MESHEDEKVEDKMERGDVTAMKYRDNSREKAEHEVHTE